MSVGWSYWAVFVPGGADICSPARPDILESQREESERCPGPRHHLLRFGPDAVDHACCCNRHLRLSLCHHVLTSVGRERDRGRGMWCAWADWCSLWFSPYSHTLHHSTPLHSTPLQQYYMGATTLELHASLVGPHYSHLWSCKHCNREMIYPIRVQQSYSVLQPILCWLIKSL